MVTGKAIKTTVAECPECENNITLKGEIEWGQKVKCPHCSTDLEVINTTPVELDWVFEDYDDEYEYDDDDDDDED